MIGDDGESRWTCCVSDASPKVAGDSRDRVVMIDVSIEGSLLFRDGCRV